MMSCLNPLTWVILLPQVSVLFMDGKMFRKLMRFLQFVRWAVDDHRLVRGLHAVCTNNSLRGRLPPASTTMGGLPPLSRRSHTYHMLHCWEALAL